MSKANIKRLVLLSTVFSLMAGCATSTRIRTARIVTPSKLPDLDHVMEAFVPIEDLNSYDRYLSQLRRDVAVPIRELQQKSVIGWFGFLIHDCPADLRKDGACIQLWLERGGTVKDDAAFRTLLPKHFLLVRPSRPNEIAGLDRRLLRDSDWTYAWKMIGECSEWVVDVLQAHEDNSQLTASQVVQFLHYITNAIGLGMRSTLSLPNGHTIQF